MECIIAQGLISEALDRQPVDNATLEEAKRHCKECPSCAAFVRSVAASIQAPLPSPSEDLPDRVMAAVRLEAARDKASQAAATSTGRSTAAAADVPSAPQSLGDHAKQSPPRPATITMRERSDTERIVATLKDPRHRRALVAWGSAAAVLLVFAGAFAGEGVRRILVPPTIVEPSMMTSGGMAPGFESAPQQRQAPQADAQDRVGGTEEWGALAAATAGDYISFDGTAYRRVVTTPDVDRSTLRTVGSTRTALDGAGAPRSFDVLAGTDRSRIYLEPSSGELIAFDRITRQYGGRTYALQTGDISQFGQWPSLPRQMSRPTSDDGSPVFRPLESDSSGARLFEPKVGGAAIGIAVGPASPPTDPSDGNPDWTWWTPVR